MALLSALMGNCSTMPREEGRKWFWVLRPVPVGCCMRAFWHMQVVDVTSTSSFHNSWQGKRQRSVATLYFSPIMWAAGPTSTKLVFTALSVNVCVRARLKALIRRMLHRSTLAFFITESGSPQTNVGTLAFLLLQQQQKKKKLSISCKASQSASTSVYLTVVGVHWHDVDCYVRVVFRDHLKDVLVLQFMKKQ